MAVDCSCAPCRGTCLVYKFEAYFFALMGLHGMCLYVYLFSFLASMFIIIIIIMCDVICTHCVDLVGSAVYVCI